MASTTPDPIPTAENHGSLPAGSRLVGIGVIVDRSLTAYKVERDPLAPGSEWVPFVHVHPRGTIEPLVVLG